MVPLSSDGSLTQRENITAPRRKNKRIDAASIPFEHRVKVPYGIVFATLGRCSSCGLFDTSVLATLQA
ncbi:MAG: hypothetical protein A2289_19610 [Deltaproteobacteria bacterium RIFOXYA12_FULL_58_15]|nr:MAG: hypothetical protein A2289_19610 [Deltaproteobacteria bacterium RIFOXYA12_FULL_58_15]